MKRRTPRLSAPLLGLIVAAAIVVALGAAFLREDVAGLFRGGNEITAQLPRDYQLVANRTEVKLAGTPVGHVTGTTTRPGKGVDVSMEVSDDAYAALRSKPRAAVRPATLLGGKYYVDLDPGAGPLGYDGDPISPDRTSTPVELDRVLEAIPPPAQQGMQHTVGSLDETLAHGGDEALRGVLRTAPTMLPQTGEVLRGVEGTRPDDLPTLISGLESIGRATTRNDGQLGSIVDSLAATSETLAGQSRPLGQFVGGLPQTLSATRGGMDALHGTLGQLRQTAASARPAVAELDPALRSLDPALANTRPLVADLRPALRDLRPAVDQLVPTAQQATGMLNDVGGATMDRLNGPVKQTVMSQWHPDPKGPYAGALFNGNKFYEELGFLGAHGASVSKYQTNNGTGLGLALGAGLDAPGGSGQNLQHFLDWLRVGALPAPHVLPPAPVPPNSRGPLNTVPDLIPGLRQPPAPGPGQ